MIQRLTLCAPRIVSAQAMKQWFVFTDAAFEPELLCGGLGAALFNDLGECVSWFGLPLDEPQCRQFGGGDKQTIIYELELAAAVLALDFWADRMVNGLQVCYGDNDGVRFSLIRGSCLSKHASALMRYHLSREATNNLCTWFARVPTEANLGDYPSRNVPHELLTEDINESTADSLWFEHLVQSLQVA